MGAPNTVVAFPAKMPIIQCPKCGVEQEAGCQCGAGYITKAEAVKRRKAKVAKLRERGQTQAQIAEEMGVSQNTISLDLKEETLSTVDNANGAKRRFAIAHLGLVP